MTQGSGIGSQARSTWGIWIRWSISARPSKPISSAVMRQVSQPASGILFRPREIANLEHDLQPLAGP